MSEELSLQGEKKSDKNQNTENIIRLEDLDKKQKTTACSICYIWILLVSVYGNEIYVKISLTVHYTNVKI